jgi:hypothetical protein
MKLFENRISYPNCDDGLPMTPCYVLVLPLLIIAMSGWSVWVLFNHSAGEKPTDLRMENAPPTSNDGINVGLTENQRKAVVEVQ